MKILKSDFLQSLVKMAFFIVCATFIGFEFQKWNLNEINIVVVYLLSVLLTARFTKGYGYGIASVFITLLTFNWFFTEPYHTLKISETTHIVSIVIMTIAAFITSALTSKVKKYALESKIKEVTSNALYQLTNHLSDAEDLPAIAGITVKTVSDVLSCSVACICFDEDGEPERTFIQQKSDGTQIRRELKDGAELRKRMEKLRGMYEVGDEFYNWPIYGHDDLLAVLRIPVATAEKMSEGQKKVVLAIIESSALAMERFIGLQAQAKTREEIEQERYRANLLRAISHDIRTPLSGIMGTSEMIMGMTDKEDERYRLARGIYEDADRLHSLVENILNLTKIQGGSMAMNKQPEAVEEVVGAAVMEMEKRVPGLEITVEMPENVIMVPMDAGLINQVLINLLDNSVKHSEGQADITVTVSEDSLKGIVKIKVLDRGCGLKEEDIPEIFQMFYTTRGKSADSKRGIGLGLAICQSIVEAHGGKISGKNRTDGPGAEFTFTLPVGGESA